MAPAGRRPGPTTTPEEILAAARSLFAERGFQATSVRAVAERAGVNAALVHHHFGSKQQLFLSALRLPLDPVRLVESVLAAGPREEFAWRFVRAFLGAWREPATGEPLRAFLRSAVGTPEGALAVRTLVEGVLVGRFAQLLGVEPLQVTAAMSHLIGLVLAATVLEVEPLASTPDDTLVELVAPAIARYLTPVSAGRIDG